MTRERAVKYSIIIPCYKQETLIEQSLDSVLAQSVHDWEMLCTDDGGPDKTGMVLDEYVRNHCQGILEYFIEQDGESKRIVEGTVAQGGVLKIIHQKNKGMSGARNAAKRLAQGEWFLNLDGDDLLSPYALEVFERCIEACPDADMLRCGFRRFADGTKPQWREPDTSISIKSTNDMIDGRIAASAFQQMVYRRRVCEGFDVEGPAWSEERLYTAKCIMRVHKYVATAAELYFYREHEGQFTRHGMTLSQCNGYLDTTREILRLYFSSGRKVEPRTARGLFLNWIEWQPRSIMIYLPKEYRREAWNHWFESLCELRSYPISCWMRLVISICRLFPCVPIALVLCYLPDWLKRKGLHR